jgi:hypothetical protein
MTKDEIEILCSAIEQLDGFEFWVMSPKDLGVYFRRFAKSLGVSILVDHRFINNLLDEYDTNGLDSEIIQNNPDLIDFVDAFFEKLHTSKLDLQGKLDKAKSMPDVTKRLQQLQNHYLNKQHWNSTIPVKPINTLTINAIRLEMPQLSGVQLISSESDALALEEQILKKYASYIDFEPISGDGSQNSQIP